MRRQGIFSDSTTQPLSIKEDMIAIQKKYDIEDDVMEDIQEMCSRDVKILIDDSGSTAAGIKCMYDEDLNIIQPRFVPQYRRIDEAMARLNQVVTIKSAYDTDGIDLYYLNATENNRKNITEKVIQTPIPDSGTPLCRRLEDVIRDAKKDHATKEKNMVIYVLTDGAPSDENRSNTRLDNILESKPDYISVTFWACTDKKQDVAYLNGKDGIPGVDVVDDYYSEKEECGGNLRYDQYLGKALCGSFNPKYDKQDEHNCNCCMIL